jgi:hypothetical protein
MERREAMRFRIPFASQADAGSETKTRCALRRSMPLVVGGQNQELTSRMARERLRVREWMREWMRE